QSDGLANIFEHTLLSHTLQLNNTATGEMWKAVFDLPVQPSFGLRAQCTQPRCIPELATLGTNKVENRQAFLFRMLAESAPKLLEIHGQALCRTQKQHRVDFGNVDSLVVQINNKNEVY